MQIDQNPNTEKTENLNKQYSVTDNLVEKQIIRFNLHKLVYNKEYIPNKYICEKIDEEMQEENCLEIIELITASKYKNELEIIGYLTYKAYEIMSSTSQKIIEKYPIHIQPFILGIALSYNPNKKQLETQYKEYKLILPDNNKILKTLKNTSEKIKQIQSLEKVFLTDQSEFKVPLIKYYLTRLSILSPKKTLKKYLEILNNVEYISKQDTIDIMLSICYGFIKKEKYKNAKKLSDKITEIDHSNIFNKEILLLISLRELSIDTIINTNKINNTKVKEFIKSIELIDSDISKIYLSEIQEKHKKYKEERKQQTISYIRETTSSIALSFSIVLLLTVIILNAKTLKIMLYVSLAIYVLSTLIGKINKAIIKKLIIKLIITIIIVLLSIFVPKIILEVLTNIFNK